MAISFVLGLRGQVLPGGAFVLPAPIATPDVRARPVSNCSFLQGTKPQVASYVRAPRNPNSLLERPSRGTRRLFLRFHLSGVVAKAGPNRSRALSQGEAKLRHATVREVEEL